jgi:hypothetical protein
VITVDVSDLRVLSAALGRSQLRLAGLAPAVLAEAGAELQRAWKSNASLTAGKHGKWYPNSIKVKPAGPLAVEVGPTPGMRQGAMSFEFGSRNQPPHLDGQRALDATMPSLKAKVEALMAKSVFG